MSNEYLAEPEHEGDHYLDLLGLGHLADLPITTKTGQQLQARDFMQICGDHARPLLVGFESMSPADPDYHAARDALRSMIGQYVGADDLS